MGEGALPGVGGVWALSGFCGSGAVTWDKGRGVLSGIGGVG